MHRGFLFAPVHFLVRGLSCLAGRSGWEVLCCQGSEEAWLTQREMATVRAGTHPMGRPHCPPGWRQRWQRERLQGEKGGETHTHSSKKQQGLPGMGYHFFTDCSYFSLVI